MAINIKKLIDLDLLDLYDSLIKQYIDSKLASEVGGLTANADTEGSIANQIKNALADLIGKAPENLNSIEKLATQVEANTSAIEEIREELESIDAISKDDIEGVFEVEEDKTL